MPKGLPFSLANYIQLIELTERCIRHDKPGHINEAQPELLARLHFSPENWLTLTTEFTRLFHGAVGHNEESLEFCQHQHRKRR